MTRAYNHPSTLSTHFLHATCVRAFLCTHSICRRLHSPSFHLLLRACAISRLIAHFLFHDRYCSHEGTFTIRALPTVHSLSSPGFSPLCARPHSAFLAPAVLTSLSYRHDAYASEVHLGCLFSVRTQDSIHCHGLIKLQTPHVSRFSLFHPGHYFLRSFSRFASLKQGGLLPQGTCYRCTATVL